jgi:hypothetical protein
MTRNRRIHSRGTTARVHRETQTSLLPSSVILTSHATASSIETPARRETGRTGPPVGRPLTVTATAAALGCMPDT